MLINKMTIMLFSAIVLCVTPDAAKEKHYFPSYNPNIRYMNEDLKKLIEKLTMKGCGYNREWKITLAEYESWIACISLAETSNLGYAAHSGSAIGRETFFHIRAGEDFPFSTSVGAFQLGNGKEWGTMPTLLKIDPNQSLQSVLRWHKNNFGNNATLADFRKKSVWYATKTKEFEKIWESVTGCAWGETGGSFNPPVTNAAPISDTIKYIGKCRWNLPDWEEGHFDTWLIKAKTFLKGKNLYSFSYYYTKNNGWEIWVWNAEGLVHCYKRHYALTYLPDKIKGNRAGFTVEKPALCPNDIE